MTLVEKGFNAASGSLQLLARSGRGDLLEFLDQRRMLHFGGTQQPSLPAAWANAGSASTLRIAEANSPAELVAGSMTPAPRAVTRAALSFWSRP